MTSLDWQRPDEEQNGNDRSQEASPDIWFPIAMGLIGLIVGFIIRRLTL